MLLTELLEEEVDDIASLVAGLILHMVLIRQGFGLLVRSYCAEINTRVFLDSVDHRHAAEGLFHINDGAVVTDDRTAADLLRQIAEHALRQLHHALVVRVSLVELHQGKLRVVAGIHALVAEHAADLIDPLQTADDQSL